MVGDSRSIRNGQLIAVLTKKVQGSRNGYFTMASNLTIRQPLNSLNGSTLMCEGYDHGQFEANLEIILSGKGA